MSPDEVVVEWPTADEIVRVVFAASKLEGCDPVDVLNGLGSARARAYAVVALCHHFPTVPRLTLSRKCGFEKAASGARAALVKGQWTWFEIERLNAVCAALSWPAMTLAEAQAAPLLYCGRSFTEFLPRSGAASSVAGEGDALAGPAREEASPPIPSSIQSGASNPCARPLEKPCDAGPTGETAPAPILECRAKATIGKASSPQKVGAGKGLRVGAAEGALAPRDAGAGVSSSAADLPPPVDKSADVVVAEAVSVDKLAENSGLVAAEVAQFRPQPLYLRPAEPPRLRPPPPPREIEDNDLPSAPPLRVSPAATALAETTPTMRKLHPMARVIDRRETGGNVTAAFCGDPTPDQRRRMAEAPGQ